MSRRETLRIFLPLGCYFLVHLLLKVLLSDGVELDEAEQFLWAQSLHLGYGAELPLYTWLQWGFFALFGTNVFALALLKDLLLFATCLFTYLGGREASNDGRGAALSMFTLILIPQIVWESQRVLTHMVLATALMAMALYFFLRIVNRGQLRHYLLFGCCAGLGMLAKYNVAILLLALLLAALSLPSYRSSFADRRWYAALALFLVIIAAPFSWLALHPDLALAKSYKLHADGGGGILAGVRNLAGAAVAFSSVPLLLFALIFSRAPRIHADDSRISERARLMGRTLLFALLICLLLILCCHVTQFRVRWMQPLLLPLPLFLSLLVRRRLTDRNQRWVRLLAASAAVAVLIIMNGRILLASHFRPTSQNEPYSRLAERCGGNLDHMNSPATMRNMLALQDRGWITTTLAEVRNRADLVVVAGSDIGRRFPRFYERCLANRETLFAEDRRCEIVFLGSALAEGMREFDRENQRRVDAAQGLREKLRVAITHAVEHFEDYGAARRTLPSRARAGKSGLSSPSLRQRKQSKRRLQPQSRVKRQRPKQSGNRKL